jgi:hypothetical protein
MWLMIAVDLFVAEANSAILKKEIPLHIREIQGVSIKHSTDFYEEVPIDFMTDDQHLLNS